MKIDIPTETIDVIKSVAIVAAATTVTIMSIVNYFELRKIRKYTAIQLTQFEKRVAKV